MNHSLLLQLVCNLSFLSKENKLSPKEVNEAIHWVQQVGSRLDSFKIGLIRTKRIQMK